MSITREQVYKALFDKVKQAPGLITTDRKLKHFSDVPPSEQPALFQTQTGEVPYKQVNTPYRWDYHAELYVYCNTSSDPAALPATQLNNIIDAIVDFLKPDWTGFQTLGGLVFNVVIDGKIETDEGVLGEQAYAIIPVKITVV